MPEDDWSKLRAMDLPTLDDVVECEVLNGCVVARRFIGNPAVRRPNPDGRGYLQRLDGSWREETDEEFARYLTGKLGFDGGAEPGRPTS